MRVPAQRGKGLRPRPASRLHLGKPAAHEPTSCWPAQGPGTAGEALHAAPKHIPPPPSRHSSSKGASCSLGPATERARPPVQARETRCTTAKKGERQPRFRTSRASSAVVHTAVWLPGDHLSRLPQAATKPGRCSRPMFLSSLPRGPRVSCPKQATLFPWGWGKENYGAAPQVGGAAVLSGSEDGRPG